MLSLLLSEASFVLFFSFGGVSTHAVLAHKVSCYRIIRVGDVQVVNGQCGDPPKHDRC